MVWASVLGLPEMPPRPLAGERLIVEARDHVEVHVCDFLTAVLLDVPDQVVTVRPKTLIER
jgi:hypothetical protein